MTLDDEGIPDYRILEDRAWDRIELTPPVRKRLEEGVDLLCFGTLAQRSAPSRAAIREAVALAGTGAWKVCDLNFRESWYDIEMATWCLDAADLVKVSDGELRELARLVGRPLPEPGADAEGIREADRAFARHLIERHGLSELCITRGIEGSEVWDESGQAARVDAFSSLPESKTAADTVGAGDGYLAMLCAARLSGRSWRDALEMATDFAAALCSIRGAIPEDPAFHDPHARALKGETNG